MSICATIGCPVIVDMEACIHDGFVFFDNVSDNIDRGYLCYVLDRESERFSRLGQIGTQGNLNTSIVKATKIALPPIKQQCKIVEILNAVDDAIEATRAVIEQTRQLKTALLQDLMTNGLPGRHANFKRHKLVGKIPEAWQVKPLLEVAKVVDCKHRTPTYQKDGFPVVRPSDVKEGKLDLSKSPRTSEEEFQDLIEKYRPKRGDIVYSRNASFGVAAYADTDEPFTIGQDVVIITSETASNRYLFYLLNSEIFKRQLNRLSAGSTFQRINLDDIRQYAISLPPQQEQNEIAAILSQVDEQVEAEEDHLEQLQSVRVALSQGLLTGQILVPTTAKKVP